MSPSKGDPGYIPPELEPRHCVICGKLFMPRSCTAVCCSHECSVKNKTERAKEYSASKQHKKTCPICGKVFYGGRGQRYCARACALKAGANSRRSARLAAETAGHTSPPPAVSLADMAARARAAGMSYGAYVASLDART